MTEQIKEIHADSGGIYGPIGKAAGAAAPRMCANTADVDDHAEDCDEG
ncbi:hypothetical protein AB0J81_39990 [Streptomyces bobili]